MKKHESLTGKKIKSYSFLNILGEGCWSVVYEALDAMTNQSVAIKVIPKSLFSQAVNLETRIQTEIKVLKQCKNENVIRFGGYFMSEDSLMIVTEYCNGGDLEHYLNKKKKLSEDEATTFLKQILNGFKGLHQVNAMHRDFKVANVLMHEGICKIADLGFAKQMESQSLTSTVLGTSITMAPEVLSEKPYGMEADIWSLGVVYYQFLYGRYPFHGKNQYDLLFNIKNSRPEYSDITISQNAKHFLDRCLTVNPKERITWREIYNHPLITKNSQRILYNLKSNINVVKNKQFYQDFESEISNIIFKMEKDKQQLSNTYFEDNFQRVDIKISENIDQLMKTSKDGKTMKSTIARYLKMYLNKRNNLMFIFKFMSPIIFNLYSIKANHGAAMFMMSKKSYHQMKDFFNILIKKQNYLELQPYFEQFVKCSSYEALIHTIKADLDIIIAQMESYKEDIGSCNQLISDQFEVNKIDSVNWERFVNDIIDTYQHQLRQHLQQAQQDTKIYLIQVIKALEYYRDHSSENTEIDEFAKMIQCLNYQKEQAKIIQSLHHKTTYVN